MEEALVTEVQPVPTQVLVVAVATTVEVPRMVRGEEVDLRILIPQR